MLSNKDNQFDSKYFLDDVEFNKIKHYVETIQKDDDNNDKQYLIREYEDYSYINEISRLVSLNYPSILNIKGISLISFNNKKRPIILSNYYQNN